MLQQTDTFYFLFYNNCELQNLWPQFWEESLMVVSEGEGQVSTDFIPYIPYSI